MASTVTVEDSFTVKAGHQLNFEGENGFELVGGGTGDPVLTVDGAVSLTGDGVVAYAVHGDASANSATLVNTVTGVIEVNLGEGSFAEGGLFECAATIINAGRVTVTGADAEGFSCFAAGSSLTNSGRIEVTGMHQALGFNGVGDVTNTGAINATSSDGSAWGVWQASGAFDNRGVITAHATNGGAYGAEVDADFRNSGHILARGDGLNYCAGVVVQFDDAHSFLNKGSIVAQHKAGDGVSYGVLMDPFATTEAVSFVNKGLIKAEFAFEALEGDPFPQITIDNAGKMIGQIDLGSHDDTLLNSGKIEGDVLLRDGDDLYQVSGGGFTAGVVYGGKGADTLTGGDGDDLLKGGAGGDRLDGGAGANSFIYSATKESRGGHADLVVSLDSDDVIDLHRIDADVTLVGDQAFHLVASFGGNAGELTLAYDAGADLTTMSVDTDGDGAADMEVRITGDATGFTGFVL